MHRIWGLLFGVVLLAALGLTAVAPWVPGWWLPVPASSYAPRIDQLFHLILFTVTFFYVLTEVLLVFNIFRFARPGLKAQYTHGSHKLELLWSIIPGVILIGLAVIQVSAWADIKYPSHMRDRIVEAADGKHFLQMGVEARQWEFRMRYPSPAHIREWDDRQKAAADYDRRMPERFDDVWVPNDVHCWKGEPVLMYLKTRDVGHALFFPNLRLKQDALPGRTIPVWFEATESNVVYDPATKTWRDGVRKEGDKLVEDKDKIFDLVCSQYCGSRHSLMRGKLFVHETKADFLAWLESAHNEFRPRGGAAAAAAR